jgi:hypothetical protein
MMPNPKIIVEDYTQLPPKTKTKKGDTDECPHCGRIGLIENIGGKIFYFHRLGYELIPGESLPGILDETCPSAGAEREP